MRDNWEYIKEAVRDIGGWSQLVLLLIANGSFTFSLATWITKGDPSFTFGWALVLLLLGQQIYAKVTPARGLAYIETIRLLANQYRARVDDWYTPGTDEHTKASAAVEYLQQNYDVEMILRKSNRNATQLLARTCEVQSRKWRTTMDDAAKREYAKKFLIGATEDFEALTVHENDDLNQDLEEEGLDYEDMDEVFDEILDLIRDAKITVSWEN